MSLLEATYDVSWAQHNYTITWYVTPSVSTSFSDFNAVMIVDQNDATYIYLGGDTNTLTMLDYTLCTTLQTVPFVLDPNTATELITRIQALNTGNITDGDLTVTGTLTVDGASTLKGAVTVQYSDLTLSSFVAPPNPPVGGNLTVDGTSTLNGAVSAGSTLAVAGTTTLTGDVSMSGTAGVGGQLGLFATGNPLYFNNGGGWVNISPTTWPSNGCTLNIPALANNSTDTIATVGGSQTFTGTNTFNGNVFVPGLLVLSHPTTPVQLANSTGYININPQGYPANGCALNIPAIADSSTDTMATLASTQTFTGTNTFSGAVTASNSISVSGAVDISASIVTYGGSGPGNLYVSMPFRGTTYKKCIMYFDNWYDTSSGYISFNIAFGNAVALVVNTTNPLITPSSISLTEVLNPGESTGSTGLWIFEGY